jgi:acetyl-CoA acetyltransferase
VRPGRLREKVAVVGVGYSAIERRSGRPIGLLALDAARQALADAGLEPKDVEGPATFPSMPLSGTAATDGLGFVSTHFVARHLGMSEGLRWRIQTNSPIPNSFIEAVNAIAAGFCDVAVVFRAIHNPAGPGGYNAFTASEAAGADQFSVPYGVHRSYQFFGQGYANYLHKYGATRQHMATLVTSNRRKTRLNRVAYFRDTALTTEDYRKARMLADPVCLFDCDIPVDGAAALVLTSAKRARQLAVPAAWIAGYGQHLMVGQAQPVWHWGRRSRTYRQPPGA